MNFISQCDKFDTNSECTVLDSMCSTSATIINKLWFAENQLCWWVVGASYIWQGVHGTYILFWQGIKILQKYA